MRMVEDIENKSEDSKMKFNLIKLFSLSFIATIAMIIEGCSDKNTVSDIPKVIVRQEILQHKGINYQQFKQQTDEEVEFYHANFYSAVVPETDATIIFSASKYNEEFATMELTDEDRSIRIEGELGELCSGVTDEESIDEFVNNLAWKEDELPEYSYAEGSGTAYYVADKYVIINFDSNGDSSRDCRFEISLNQSEKISAASYAWLVWEDE